MGHDNYFIIFRLWQERQEIIEERERRNRIGTHYMPELTWDDVLSLAPAPTEMWQEMQYFEQFHTHCIVVSRPRHTQHVNTFIKFHTKLPLSALCRNNGHPGTHTQTECLSLVIMGASNTLSFSLFKSITNLSVTIFSYKVYFLHRWIKPQPAHTQATWLPAVWLTARRPKVNVLGGMQCFSTVVGCIHYKEKAHPPPITFGTHKKREKKDSGGEAGEMFRQMASLHLFSSVNWSPFQMKNN